MKAGKVIALVTAVLVWASTGEVQAQKVKVIVDQDARGPATTDMQSILIVLQSDKFEVLGITTVSGDQWVKEETRRTLRLLEIAGRTDVPVIAPAQGDPSGDQQGNSGGEQGSDNGNDHGHGYGHDKSGGPKHSGD